MKKSNHYFFRIQNSYDPKPQNLMNIAKFHEIFTKIGKDSESCNKLLQTSGLEQVFTKVSII